MSSIALRLLVGFAGTILVGFALLSWRVHRRRQRKRSEAVAPDRAAAGEVKPRSGWLQSLVVSIVASVISGVMLFFITPLFAPDMVVPPSETSQVTSSDSSNQETQSSLGTEAVAVEPEPEAAEQAETAPATTPAALEEEHSESGQPMDSPVEVTPPDVDVSLADATAEWSTLLQPPGRVDIPIVGDGRLQLVGVSTSAILQLTEPESLVPLGSDDPRIRLDGVSMSQIMQPTAPTSSRLAIDPRPLIEGACVVKVLVPAAPIAREPQLRTSRILIEGARTASVLNLNVPELGDDGT